MIEFTILNPRATADHLGLIPMFLSEHNPEPAATQLDAKYQHGGGWRPMAGWAVQVDDSIVYPGDPALYPLAKARLRDETILVYPHAWVVVIQPNGDFEISRMD